MVFSNVGIQGFKAISDTYDSGIILYVFLTKLPLLRYRDVPMHVIVLCIHRHASTCPMPCIQSLHTGNQQSGHDKIDVSTLVIEGYAYYTPFALVEL